MDRRYFFKLVSALFSPPASRIIGSPKLAQSSKFPRQKFSESALAEWLKIPMQPIYFPRDLPEQVPPHALQILTAIHQPHRDIKFIYHGGSDPGQSRRALPVLLFQKIDAEADSHTPNASPIYLLAYCLTRNAPRTFRLDRIQQSLSPLNLNSKKPASFLRPLPSQLFL